MQSLDVKQRSATTTPPPGTRQATEIAQLIDVSKCIGCKACQVACMEWNDLREEIGSNVGIYENPVDMTDKAWTVMRFAEQEPDPGKLEWLIRKDSCMHCGDPGCLAACPAPGAIVQYANGIVDFIAENCIGCGYCRTGCPFDVPRLSRTDNRAYKCNMCVDRVAVGMEPACVKTCPTGAIAYGTKEDMRAYGEQRVVDLQERGYRNAGVYDPAGVGGTHMMYVLQHADKPEIYNNLPREPKVAGLVNFWSGAAKPLGLLALGLTALGAFFHYIKVGRSEVEEERVPVRVSGRESEQEVDRHDQ